MTEPAFTFTHEVRPLCEIGMSETRQAEPDSWVDVSCYVHEAELFRGRDRFTDRFAPGTASVVFDNRAGWADLGGTYAEVAAAVLRPGRQIRIGVNGNWTPGMSPFTRWLYRGFIDQATPTYDPVLHDVVTIQCIDALGESGSSTAPTGEYQGVNETVSQRLNRILDAVGWWGTKRKISATSTTVQGTRLGGGAIDMLGQAADSAGGVIYGDLDGDVVFKDIDWMLYDPDDPPDGEIGPGDPGEEPDDTPPYINPEEGDVHDPDDPPSEHPPKVCVCADGSKGTLVEKGDNYRLFVQDGHLFYESSGHVWNLGPYSGGCTCVEPPTDEDPPIRQDEDEDGNPEGPPIEGLEDPDVRPFAVELLAWSDGGLTDPPTTAVTVPGITPGHDCILVTLISAIGALTDTTGLAPVVAGGGLDWSHTRGADRSGGVASSWMMLTQVGRDDPGTFDITVTWTPPATSRTHAVTVWKVTGAADNYLERFDGGAVLYGIGTSNLPDHVQPGDGPVTVDLNANQQPTEIEALTRVVDITIAQSLAEETTGPFGATFAGPTGEWIIPPNVPVAAPVLLVDGRDDFDRADGPLGPGWTNANPVRGVITDLTFSIVDAGVVCAEDVSAGQGWGFARTTTESAADVMEIELSNVFESTDDNNGIQVEIYTHVAADGSAMALYLNFAYTDGFRVLFWELYGYGTDGVPGETVDAGTYSGDLTGSSFVVRLESAGDVHTGFVDGVELGGGTLSVPPGPFVGFAMSWTSGTIDAGPPRVEYASAGTVAAKTSWIAGWRQGYASSTVDFADVNLGVDDYQSAQACLVLESPEIEPGWRLLDFDLDADLGDGTTPAGTFTFRNPPRPGTYLVVMVGVTASTDIIDSVMVTGVDLIRSHVQHKTGSSWGQGAIFTGEAPLDFDPGSWALTVTYPALESISAVVYEVAAADVTTPVGGVAAGVLGDRSPGSVDGASTITMSAAGSPTGIALAYLHVAADEDEGSGATTVEGDEWHEEFQFSPGFRRAYLQVMSRAPAQPESTSTSVHWEDVQTGTADTYSAVQLAVEIRLMPDTFFIPAAGGAGVSLGGVNDPWNGIITSAGAFNPDGTPLWTFP